MSAKLPFHASGNTGAVPATTSGSTPYELTQELNGTNPQVRVTNCSTHCGFISFGTTTVTAAWPTTAASADGYMIGPNSCCVLTPGYATHVASVSDTTGAVMYVAPGSGGS
jgi:hypothetical protein